MKSQELELTSLATHLPKEIEPQNDLWGKIEMRLDVPLQETPESNNHSRYERSLRLFTAASVILFTVLLGTQLPKILTTPLSQIVSNSASHSALLATIDDIQLTHEKQIKELKKIDRLINWQTSPFSSPVETGIEQLRAAAKEIYQTLKQSPTDKQLWQLWLWTQQREIELLRQGQKLPTPQNSQGETI